MCRNIFDYYGIDNQKNQLIQELGELIVAITKDNLENIIEEMADVLMYYNDIMLCYNISAEELKTIYSEKFNKNMNRW